MPDIQSVKFGLLDAIKFHKERTPTRHVNTARCSGRYLLADKKR
jgi:hypothetical protein